MKMLSRVVQSVRSYSLLRCRTSESRRWRCTISSEASFPKNESSVFVMAGCDDFRIIDKRGATTSYIPPWITPESSVKMRKIRKVSNSCNGLMLIAKGNSIYLFNPATKYFQKVLQLYCYEECRYFTQLGLYYDPSIDDYKALVWFRQNGRQYPIGQFYAQASLKGKQWTKVDFPIGFRCVEEGPVLNGRLHWLAQLPDARGDENFIVCFNPVSNVFERFPSPPAPGGSKNNIIMGLAVMDGCLWLTRWKISLSNHWRDEIEVFKMEEYGVAESWTLVGLINILSNVKILIGGSMIPLHRLENGEVLFSKTWAEQTNHGEIISFNPETNWCLTHSVTPSRHPKLFPFMNNLASPVGYYWDPIEHQHFGHFEDVEYDYDST